MFNFAARPYNIFLNLYLFFILLFFFASCSTVRDYPVNKPFVYETNINLSGKFNTDERKLLIDQLEQQLHDSIQVRAVQKLIGWKNGPRFFYSELSKPAVYD
ncbi:MAG TPA: hypothetical protein VER36_09050, partial [Flavisolibacter sp.]|nr:hypothetical protein [Flavisolibacter sp.]